MKSKVLVTKIDYNYCPACLGTACRPFLLVTAEEAAQHFVTDERDHRRHDELVKIITELWQGSTCEIYICDECGFGFSIPFVAGNPSFYNVAYPGASYPSAKWEFSRTVKALQDDHSTDKAALEIGAGAGFFFDMVCGRFFDKKRMLAIEFNDTARVRLHEKGYNAIGCDFRSPDVLETIGKFDYIFMFQCLEHMDKLEELFSSLRSLTQPSGKVFIAVPNLTRIQFQEESGSLLDMPPNHIGRWNLQAFEAVTGRHGFKVIGHEIEPFDVLEYVQQDVLYYFKKRAQQRGSFSNYTQRISLKWLRRIAEAMAAVMLAPMRVTVWARASHMKQMGGALWVQLQRENQ